MDDRPASVRGAVACAQPRAVAEPLARVVPVPVVVGVAGKQSCKCNEFWPDLKLDAESEVGGLGGLDGLAFMTERMGLTCDVVRGWDQVFSRPMDCALLIDRVLGCGLISRLVSLLNGATEDLATASSPTLLVRDSLRLIIPIWKLDLLTPHVAHLLQAAIDLFYRFASECMTNPLQFMIISSINTRFINRLLEVISNAPLKLHPADDAAFQPGLLKFLARILQPPQNSDASFLSSWPGFELKGCIMHASKSDCCSSCPSAFSIRPESRIFCGWSSANSDDEANFLLQALATFVAIVNPSSQVPFQLEAYDLWFIAVANLLNNNHTVLVSQKCFDVLNRVMLHGLQVLAAPNNPSEIRIIERFFDKHFVRSGQLILGVLRVLDNATRAIQENPFRTTPTPRQTASQKGRKNKHHKISTDEKKRSKDDGKISTDEKKRSKDDVGKISTDEKKRSKDDVGDRIGSNERLCRTIVLHSYNVLDVLVQRGSVECLMTDKFRIVELFIRHIDWIVGRHHIRRTELTLVNRVLSSVAQLIGCASETQVEALLRNELVAFCLKVLQHPYPNKTGSVWPPDKDRSLALGVLINAFLKQPRIVWKLNVPQALSAVALQKGIPANFGLQITKVLVEVYRLTANVPALANSRTQLPNIHIRPILQGTFSFLFYPSYTDSILTDSSIVLCVVPGWAAAEQWESVEAVRTELSALQDHFYEK